MKKNISEFIKKIFDVDNLPSILFVVSLINFMPILIFNGMTKGPTNGISTVIKVLLLIIEYIILIAYYLVNSKKIKINFRKIICLFIITIILFGVQLYNYFSNNFYFFDVLNVGIFFVNVLLFYILADDYKIKEEKIIAFHKTIVYFALISIIWTFIFFFREIIAQIGIISYNVDYSYINNIKGFFSNRAALSFVILIAIISNSILIRSNKSKKIYYFFYIIFFVGVWATHSKTEYLIMIFMFIWLIFMNHKWRLTKKILLSFLTFSICCIGFANVLGKLPNVSEKINYVVSQHNERDNKSNNSKPRSNETTTVDNEKSDTNAYLNEKSKVDESDAKLNELVVGKDRLFRLSGRVDIWESAINFLRSHPWRILFGVGKFNSTQQLYVNGILYEHFHNLAIELIMTGGIIELFYVIVIFLSVLVKVFKSNLCKNAKYIYLLSLVMYAGVSMVETYGKISIGYYDCLCLIFFITIPLLHANSLKNNTAKSNRRITNVALIDYDISVLGGVEKVTEELSNNFVNKYNVFVISLNKENGKVPHTFNKKVKIIYSTFNRNKRLRNVIVKNYWNLSKILEKNKIDIALCMGHYAAFVAVFCKKNVSTKFIYCDHGAYINSIDDKLMCFIRKTNYRLSDYTVLLTKRNYNDYIQYVKADENKMSYIYNFYSRDDYMNYPIVEYNKNSHNIVTISRLSYEKGLDLLLDTANELNKIYHREWEWHVYGGGNMLEEIKDKIKELNLTDRIILEGEVKNAKNTLEKYALYCLTSYREGLPIVLLEAKIKKLPIVSFDVLTGPNEIVQNNVNGFLIECYDTKKMAQKIKYLLEKNDIRIKFSKNTEVDLDKFNEENIMNEWYSLINRIRE